MPARNSKFQVDPGNAAYIFIAPPHIKTLFLSRIKLTSQSDIANNRKQYEPLSLKGCKSKSWMGTGLLDSELI